MLDMQSKTLEKIEGELERMGLPIPLRPERDAPTLPANLSELDSKELGRLLGVLAGWVSYAQYQVARADVLRISKRARYETKRARLYLTLRQDENLTEKEREAAIEMNEEMQGVKLEMVQAEAFYEMVKALHGGYLQHYNALSRELTRKGISTERGYA